MQAFTRASATLSQVLIREQRILMTSVSVKHLHRSAPAGTEAMPLPTVEKVNNIGWVLLFNPYMRSIGQIWFQKFNP